MELVTRDWLKNSADRELMDRLSDYNYKLRECEQRGYNAPALSKVMDAVDAIRLELIKRRRKVA